MISLPFLLKQPTFSGCLPTTVRAVLLWALCEESSEDCEETLVPHQAIADLCHENESGLFGCDWDVAVAELGNAYNVEDLTGDVENIQAAVLDTQDPQPVVAILGDRSGSTTVTHAIAILDIREELPSDSTLDEAEEIIVFYDPEDGDIRELRGVDFWSGWSLGGEYALLIRP